MKAPLSPAAILQDTRLLAGPQDEGEQCGNGRQSAVEFPAALFHEAVQPIGPFPGRNENEACSLWREGCGKARPDRQIRPVARSVGPSERPDWRGLFAR